MNVVTVTRRAERLKPITTATPVDVREKAYGPDRHERVLRAADSLGLALCALTMIDATAEPRSRMWRS